MDVGGDQGRLAVFGPPAPAAQMILLDTNALIWLASDHRRAAPLVRARQRLYVSPACLLELQMLVETGRVRLEGGLDALAADPRWAVDTPDSGAWFQDAWSYAWTRDPFDRLIVAHAHLRGWKLASGDQPLLDRLGPGQSIEL
jgi:PIN domain nuclease of toxin-antitoxin system